MESTPALSNLERQEQLVRFVEERQRVTVAEIAQRFGISVATVRRDLELLDAEGRLQRFHGGAIPVRKAPPESPIIQRISEQQNEKRRIGQAAAQLIRDGETLFLGSGTTVLEVAKNLRSRRGLTVITNSLLVLNELATAPDITVVGLGGVLRSSEMSLIGHLTEQALGEVRAQKIIMGIRSIDLEHGLTNDYLPETMTDRSILGQTGEIIVVADHTKCERVSAAYLAPLSIVDRFVTDSKAPDEFIRDLRAADINVLIA